MTDEAWNEYNLVEKPFIESLQAMGYSFIPSSQLNEERDSPKDIILTQRLIDAILRINDWITPENAEKIIRRIMNVKTTGIDANRQIYNDLVNYVSIEQDVGGGKKHQTVKLIDWNNPENNEFIVTNQMRFWGHKENIIPDIVIYVNGLPLVIVECKSPTTTEPMEKAVKQLLRYQDNAIGVPKLFETNQIVIATCGQAASYATIGAKGRHFRQWKDPWTTKIPDLKLQIGRDPNPQEIMLEGMFRKSRLLDIIRNFVVFDVTDGKIIKKLARYQQFRAVNKAIYRIQHSKDPKERGGIVWHTQGSGKSLTMVWMALKLRRMEKEFKNPIILVVTDRIDLDGQIGSTFHDCGFPNPSQAKGVDDLRKKLQAGSGQTIFTTLQKFIGKEGEKPGDYPILSDSSDIYVMVDEAHRTQYKNLATNMRTALPNACYLGFTGTPIDKKDRSTIRTFGSYIDKYSIKESVDDGATVPIVYEGRLPHLWVEGESLDAIFDRVFKNYTEEEKEEIRKRYANWEQIAGAPERVKHICLDLVQHYETHIAPNKFKAQVVTVNKVTAVRFKEMLDKLNAPQSEIIISSSNDDPEEVRAYHRSKTEIQNIIDKFKNPQDPLSILVVCEMLLTGFDAPIEQVMYLDKPLKDHSLLQAIARVNRPYNEDKSYGLIVDYYGVSQFLEKALEIFDDADIEGAKNPISSELPRLQTRHRAALRFFEGIPRKDLEASIKILEPEDLRADFNIAFKRFSQSMDMLLPDPIVNPYRGDLVWLGKIRVASSVRYERQTMNLEGCGEKVRQLIDEHIRTSGIEQLIEPISILDDNFSDHVNGIKSDDARASEMEHAIRHEINIRMEDNPEYYTSLKKRLEEIINAKKEMRMEVAKVIEMLRGLVSEVKEVNKVAQTLGFNETEFAFYGILKTNKLLQSMQEQHIRDLTHEIVNTLSSLAVLDWTMKMKDDVQRQMRRHLKELLRDKVDDDDLEPLTLRLVDLARVRLRR